MNEIGPIVASLEPSKVKHQIRIDISNSNYSTSHEYKLNEFQ